MTEYRKSRSYGNYERLAFTLVELLTVIAVIGMLVALLLPALHRARMKARQITCLNSQKSAIAGTLIYGADNKHMFPDPRDKRWGNLGVSPQGRWQVWFNEYVGGKEVEKTKAGVWVKDAAYDAVAADVWGGCPSMKPPTSFGESHYGHWGRTAKRPDYSDKFGGFLPCLGLRILKVKRPGEAAILVDTMGTYWLPGGGGPAYTGTGTSIFRFDFIWGWRSGWDPWGSTPKFLHGKAEWNIAFLDGSVASVPAMASGTAMNTYGNYLPGPWMENGEYPDKTY